MALLLGIDAGTSGCKVVAINERGKVLASSMQTYPTRYPKPGWAEQEPEEWYQASCKAIRDCLHTGGLDSREIVGLSVDGPAHNVALMNESGEVIYPTIHWSDLRSTAICESLKKTHGDRIFEITYQQTNPSWTLAQLLWLKKNEPLIWSQLRRILVTKDYIRYRLAGTYQTDVYDAVGMQLYDIKADCWSAELAELVGWDVGLLPPVAAAITIAGGLTAGAALDLGLPPDVPVAVGSGDSVTEAFGVGATEPGQCVIKVASASNVDLVSDGPRPSLKTITYPHVVPNRWFSICATNCGTSTLRWFRDSFCRQEITQAGPQGLDVYDLIERLSAGAPAGCEGLVFHPYLMGERGAHWDPWLRGDFVGISARHKAQHFARAIQEGVAFSIRECYEVIESLGQPITERRLVGGGARSQLWRQILCDVLGEPLVKPASGDAALGSALLAGVAVGIFPDRQSAAGTSGSIEAELRPDPEIHAIYNDYFDSYRAIQEDMTTHSHRLASLANRTTGTESITIE